MVECGFDERRVRISVKDLSGVVPIEGVRIKYGNEKIRPDKTPTTDKYGAAEFCYTRLASLYVSLQKTDYVFSDSPYIPRVPNCNDPSPKCVNWGGSSLWLKISPFSNTKRIYAFPKPPEIPTPVEVIEEICKRWETQAKPNVPTEVNTYFRTSLPISISGAKWVCPDLGTYEIIDKVTALVKLNGSTIAEIPINNGIGGRVDLGESDRFNSTLESLTARGATSIPIVIEIPDHDGGYTPFPFNIGIPTPEIPKYDIPLPEIEQACEVGEKVTARCADGSYITTLVCKNVGGVNQWVPTGNVCPTPQLAKTAKIITSPDGELQAYDGMNVTITTSVMCGSTPSSGEPAFLIVDGEQVDSKNTSLGFVTFTWEATTVPARTHRIVVRVPKSDTCPGMGEASDSKNITVSRIIPGIEDQLKLEREAYQSQLEALRAERQRIRDMSLSTIPTVPPVIIPVVPPIEIPITPPVTPPIVPPVTPPVEPPVEIQPGIISIPSIITPPTEYPIEIFIDGVLKGQPPLQIEVDPGTYHVTVKLTNFTPLDMKVTITEGQTVTISDLEFLQ